MAWMGKGVTDAVVSLPGGGPHLAVRRAGGLRRPFVLVHGLASNARVWDGVTRELAEAGHAVIAVDQRGHGRSDVPLSGYNTLTCADDLAALIASEGLLGPKAPVVVGQSWGGNVVLALAAHHPQTVAAVACVDGGWIRLADHFATFDQCWEALAPPSFDGVRYADLRSRLRERHPDWPELGLEGTLGNLRELPDGGVRNRLDRHHHAAILRSLYDADPAALYPRVRVPALLVPTVGQDDDPDDDAHSRATRLAVRAALRALPRPEVRWYPGADHDIHAQYPQRLARDLLALAADLPLPPRREDTGDFARRHGVR